jgi:hypothetical protein
MVRSALLGEIEERVRQLSREEQLWLIERLAKHLRADASTESSARAQALASMAAGQEVQRELRQIEKEFGPTEGDGLEQD